MCELMFSVFLENFYRFLLFENVEVGTLFHYLRKMMTMMINAHCDIFFSEPSRDGFDVTAAEFFIEHFLFDI